MKKEKILKIIIFLLLIVMFSITIAVTVLKYNKKDPITSENNEPNIPEKHEITKENVIKIIENNYDTSNKIIEIEEKEEYFIVYLKNKETEEEEELAVSKDGTKISEVHHVTVKTG